MKSIKISEKANLQVVNLSEKFHMSKQSFVSLILENINSYEVQSLLTRELLEDEYPVGYEEGKYIYADKKAKSDEEVEFEEDEDITVEDEIGPHPETTEIKGL